MLKNSMKHLLSFALLLSFTAAHGQIESTISQLTEANGEGYIKPLIESFGFGLNRGVYQDAKIPKFGLHVKLGVAVIAVGIPDSKKFYTATTQGDFRPVQSLETSTVFGPETAASVEGEGGTVFSFPGGLNMDGIAVAAPQLTVGSFLGTEAALRYIVVDLGDADIGSLNLTGFGIRHNLSQYLLLSPLDLSAGFFWQNLKVGDDLVNLTSSQLSVQASKRLGLLSLYGGAGIDMSSGSVKYSYNNNGIDETLEYNLDGENGVFFTLGASFRVLIASLYADMTFGAFSGTALGINFGF